MRPAFRRWIESALSNLREALKGDDAEALKRAMENLQKSSHKVAEAMYQTAGAQQTQGGGPSQEESPKGDSGKGGGDDDVIDAEYEVKE